MHFEEEHCELAVRPPLVGGREWLAAVQGGTRRCDQEDLTTWLERPTESCS